MFSDTNKCLFKGIVLGLGVGMTVGFLSHMLTAADKTKCGIKKTLTKALKTAQSLISDF